MGVDQPCVLNKGCKRLASTVSTAVDNTIIVVVGEVLEGRSIDRAERSEGSNDELGVLHLVDDLGQEMFQFNDGSSCTWADLVWCQKEE